MEREILLLGDERLYRVCDPVHPEELADMPALIADMRDTILAYRRKMGAGRAIAAPQTGVCKRVVCMCLHGEPVAFLNPVLTFPDGEMMEVLDDCMSFPHLRVRLKRYRRCVVHYRDLQWREGEMALEGDLSELLQHECDHLDGVLATMRAQSARDLVMDAH
ncbi:MAG TPA: peptide deformylase [Candidatus Pullichristensenella stercorigallinarum]|uniref:Peptide deformylase n=1 Tax=Candidatus Pullichristensenella stercorigallinarum TaxID=2840909 RepID=A0A9D0ZNZ4_9FIRM|nr:peptide deformylase [Candidatus Pullichristensenella stercorigallinarum]